MKIPSLTLLLAALAGSAQAAPVDITWKSNSDAVWNTASNWDLNNVPDNSGERAVFNGTGSQNAVTFTSTGIGNGSPNGIAGVLVKSTQTSALSINATTSTSQFRFFGGVTIESGAGAFSLGTSGGNIQLIPNSAATVTFQNDSSNTATLGNKITAVNGGGGSVSTLQFSGSGNWQIDMAYAGSTAGSKLIKDGAGTTTMTGANNYTGATTINGGTLKAGVASVANTSGAFGKGSAVTFANVAGATMDITGFDTEIGSLAGGGTTGGNVVLGAATLTTGRDNTNTTYAGGISGSGGGVTKIGTGTQTLTGTNTYTGGTTITAGTLAFNSGSLGTTGAISMNGGALQWNGTNTEDVSPRITMAAGKTATFDTNGNNVAFASAIGSSTTGALTKTGAGTLTLNAASTYTGGTTITAGALAFNSGSLGTTGAISMNGGTLRWNGTNTEDVSPRIAMVAGKTATFDTNGNNVAFASAIGSSTTGALAKIGAGTLTLNAANTYTGGTTINDGTLALGTSGTLGSGTISVDAGNSATLDLLGTTARTLTSSTITIGTGGQLTIKRSDFTAAAGAATNLTGALSGAGTLVIGGTPNTAVQRTRFAFNATLGGTAFDNFSGAINIQSGANLALFNGTLTSTNSNNLTVDSGGYVTLLGGTTTFVGVLNGGGSFTKNTASDTATLSVASGNFSGVIASNLLGGTGTTALIKTSTGTLALSGSNTYTGDTTISVNGGALLVTGTHTGAGNYTVNSGGTLGGGTTLGSGTPTITLASGKTFTVATGGQITAGTVGTLGQLNIAGTSGAVHLNGTYLFDVNYGANPSTTGTGDLINITGASSLDLSGGTFTLNSPGSAPVAGTRYAIRIFQSNVADAAYAGAGPHNLIGSAPGSNGLKSYQSIVTWDNGKTFYLVPEPASFILLGLGSLLLLRRPSCRRGRTA